MPKANAMFNERADLEKVRDDILMVLQLTTKLAGLIADYMDRTNDLARRVEELEKQKGLVIT